MQKLIDNFDSLSEEMMTKYAGKWIAVINGDVVASGKSFKEVYELVKIKHPKSKPLYGLVPEAVPLVFNVL